MSFTEDVVENYRSKRTFYFYLKVVVDCRYRLPNKVNNSDQKRFSDSSVLNLYNYKNVNYYKRSLTD